MGLFDEVFGAKSSSILKSPEPKLATRREPHPVRSSRPLVVASRSGATGSTSTVASTSSTTPNKLNDPRNISNNKSRSIATSIKEKAEPKTRFTKKWFNASTNSQVKNVSKPVPVSTIGNDKVKHQGTTRISTIGRSAVTVVDKLGQTQASSKSEQVQLQGQIRDDLTRSSSVTNLNADTKNKGAFSKLRNSASKDRLDKLIEKKNEKKASNNNKVVENEIASSLESAYEIELLQKQLNEMAKEKSDLVLELGERREELHGLKNEIVKLKMFQEQSNIRIDQLCDENTLLRNRLRDVAHSPLSDNEKQQLLLDSQRHSSAPASIALNILDDDIVGDITACPTPDWDKHSSSNISEVSVACLQDKINQMQETHYSTNEELQATLQELTDLQRQLTELQQDNERLLDEKNLMFDSLCRQTERLNDARIEVESLKQLLYRDKDETGQFESIVDREHKLVDLLKSAQDERETVLVKQEQLNNELQDIRTSNNEHITEIKQLTERVSTLESTLDAKHAEHRQLDQELAIAKDQCSGRQIEINRLTDLLDNARTKINELEQERALNDKSEIDELLDNTRKEKDCLESEVANLKEQVARSRNETEKLKEQVSILQEEYKVTRNNAKCTQSELEYKCEKLNSDKANLSDQLQQLQEAANELQVQTQCQLEDKRQLSAVLSETQRNLSAAERRNAEFENELEELKKLRKDENEEWEKFQSDLLTSVRVANDFKSEAQEELQKMIMENKSHRERIRQLESQIDKMKGSTQTATVFPAVVVPTTHDPNSMEGSGNHQEDQMTAVTHKLGEDIFSKNLGYIDVTKASSNFLSNYDPNTRKSTKRIFGLPNILKKISKVGSSENLDTSNTTASNAQKYYKPRKYLKSDIKRDKHVSFQEERDLAILNNLYSQIDQNQPDEYLTPNQRYILKLKDVFDEEANNPKLKHTSKLSKDKVSISKPLLDSVLNNPRLKQITESLNPSQLDTGVSEFDEIDVTDSVDGNLKYVGKFDDSFHANLEFKPDIENNKIQDTTTKYLNMDNVHCQMKSDNTNENKKCNKIVPIETLNVLYSEIDPTIPEDHLTKEQKFVIKLKKSLDEMGRKTTLKRKPINRNTVKISEPIQNSIITNPALFSILKDPNIKSVEELNKLDTLSEDGSSVQFMEIEEADKLQRSASCTDLYHYREDSCKDSRYLSTPNILQTEIDSSANSQIYRTRRSYDLLNLAEHTMKKYNSDEAILRISQPEVSSTSNVEQRFLYLNDDEFRLMERVKSNSEFQSPTFDINEEDLEIIKFAQQKYSGNCNDKERNVYNMRNELVYPRALSLDSATKYDHHQNYIRFLKGMICDNPNENTEMNFNKIDNLAAVEKTSNPNDISKINSKNTNLMNTVKLEKNSKTFGENNDLLESVFGDERKFRTTYITKDGKIFGVVKYKNVAELCLDNNSQHNESKIKHSHAFTDVFRNNLSDVTENIKVKDDVNLIDSAIFHDAEEFNLTEKSINLEVSTSTSDLICPKDINTQTTNDDIVCTTATISSNELNNIETLSGENTNQVNSFNEEICRNSRNTDAVISDIGPRVETSNILKEGVFDQNLELNNNSLDLNSVRIVDTVTKDPLSKFEVACTCGYNSCKHDLQINDTWADCTRLDNDKTSDTTAKNLNETQSPDIFTRHACNNNNSINNNNHDVDNASLDHIATFHILNNPPRCKAYYPPTIGRPVSHFETSNGPTTQPRQNSKNFESTRKRFENIIQSYKSETVRTNTLNKMNQSIPCNQNKENDKFIKNTLTKF